MKNSLLKSMRFNMDDEADRKLYEWLSHLQRGEFSERTKLFWKMCMEVEKEESSFESIWRKKMEDAVNRIEIPWLAEMKKEREGK